MKEGSGFRRSVAQACSSVAGPRFDGTCQRGSNESNAQRIPEDGVSLPALWYWMRPGQLPGLGINYSGLSPADILWAPIHL